MTPAFDRLLVRFASTVAAALVLAAVAGAQSPAPSPSGAGAVPQTVLGALQRAYPGATIASSSKEDVDGIAVIRIDCTDKGQKRVVRYKPDGSLLEAGEPVTEQQLPVPVAAAMHSHPRAIFGGGLKLTRGASVHYELTLRGTRKTTMLVKPDGTVISFK
jgi:hypothetical protein